MTNATCNNTQMVPIDYKVFLLDGVTPGTLDGPLRAVILEGGGDWMPDPDGNPLRIYVKSGTLDRETCRFRVLGDADLDPGPDQVRDISDEVTLEVKPAEAASLSATVGVAVPKV